jgi:hypothetical protein
MLDLFDIYQHRQIAEAQDDASTAKLRAVSAETKSTDLEYQVQNLKLICQAMWELLRERSGLSDEDLLSKIKDVDQRDGAADGKIGTTKILCPKCARPSGSNAKQCIYCGEPTPAAHVFASKL